MAFNDSVKTMTVCSDLNSLRHASWSVIKNLMPTNRKLAHSNLTFNGVTAANGQSSAKNCFSWPNFLCYTLSNNTDFEEGNLRPGEELIDHVHVIVNICGKRL